MKVYYQTVIDGVASVVREARELLMARKKDSDQSLADVANRRFVVDRVLPKAERHWHWQTCFFLDLTSIGDGLEAVDMCISSSPCCHRGWLGWLAGWLAGLPACLLACCLARMLGCSVACLLPCLACLLAGWLACLLPAWLACLLTCLLASLCAPREGGRAVQHRHTCGERMRDRRSQDFGKADNNTGTHVGRQWETRVDKTLGRRTHHPTRAHMWGDKGRQDLGKADRPSNKGKREGRQGETRPRKGGHTIQQRETRGKTRPPEGGHTIQQKKARRETMRDKGKHWEAKGEKARHNFKKAGTSSNTCRHVGDKRRQELGNADQHRHTSGRRTHHPTQAHMWGDNGRQ